MCHAPLLSWTNTKASQLHVQGKTEQAKTDLARLAKIRAEREAAQEKRKAEQEGEYNHRSPVHRRIHPLSHSFIRSPTPTFPLTRLLHVLTTHTYAPAAKNAEIEQKAAAQKQRKR